jgi:hypothetical protein
MQQIEPARGQVLLNNEKYDVRRKQFILHKTILKALLSENYSIPAEL